MEVFHFGFQAMGSNCEVVLADETMKQAQSVAGVAIEEIARIERKYSRYRQEESIVSHINASAGSGWVECDEETVALFTYADSLFEGSDGLFDITSGILRTAWDFSKAVIPAQATLDALLRRIGWDRVDRRGQAIRLPVKGMQLDFGGFGKEYAADRAATILHGKGVRHGFVNLAGDIRVIGPKPDDTPWLIAVRHPRERERMMATIPMYTGALATSGDYERYFELDGRRYCHILHPRTGYPVTGWQSVTVVAPLAVHAGSCSTITMLREDDGLSFLESTGARYLAVDKDGKTYHKNSYSKHSQSKEQP